MADIKIHVHPTPMHNDYDHCVPFYGIVYDRDSYCDHVNKLVGKDDRIVLISNGEPDQRLYLAKHILDSQFKNVVVESSMPRYASHDTWFEKNTFRVVPKTPRNFDELINYYLAHYQQIPFVESGSPVSFRGFKKNNKVFWYHYGHHMPDSPCDAYHQLNARLEPIFQDLVTALDNQLGHVWSRLDIERNLLIRINHNEPNSEHDPGGQFFQMPHLDTSIITAWIWSSGSGAVLCSDQQGTDSQSVMNLFDQHHEYCVIPGLDYCDFSQSMTPATWHGVRSELGQQHRVSLVAFLRHPHSGQ